MYAHESAFLLNSFQNYETKYWVPCYFAMKKNGLKYACNKNTNASEPKT